MSRGSVRDAVRITECDASAGPDFRRAMSRFASGVVLVTARDGEDLVGMTCQSFTSLSLKPPLVTFAAGRGSTSFPRLCDAGEVCISVLSREQDWLSSQFAVSGGDKWRSVGWSPGRNGAPRVSDAVMWCEGRIEIVHEVGDHLLAIVAVSSLATADGPVSPLIFHDGRYTGLHHAAG
ncbi:flavin reductase family protein [Amycolatopsis pithecellobii]|uniref:Flavin reductase n=1 Tax=Amycolatopsis pithecellobii TaxID=664692 RepID=A0A6N7Z251_9PSEU|nr:flavin reductase family protein [Amycolatopsis pithecellobii]MTD55643.1 flavin reductase [Amycolatopsis pithecellobii]